MSVLHETEISNKCRLYHDECAQKHRLQVEQETSVLPSNFGGFVFGLFNFFF